MRGATFRRLARRAHEARRSAARRTEQHPRAGCAGPQGRQCAGAVLARARRILHAADGCRACPCCRPPPQVEKAAPQDTARPQPVFAGRPGPAPRPVPVRVAFPAALAPDPPAAAHPQPQGQSIRVDGGGRSQGRGGLFEADRRSVLAMGRADAAHRHRAAALRGGRRRNLRRWRRRPRAGGCGVTQGAAAGARRVPCGQPGRDSDPGRPRRLCASDSGGELRCQQPGRDAGRFRDRSPGIG